MNLYSQNEYGKIRLKLLHYTFLMQKHKVVPVNVTLLCP